MSRRRCALVLTAVFCVVLLFSFSCLIVHSREHDSYALPCAFCATLMQRVESFVYAVKIALVFGLFLRMYSMRRFVPLDPGFFSLCTPVQLKIKLLN